MGFATRHGGGSWLFMCLGTKVIGEKSMTVIELKHRFDYGSEHQNFAEKCLMTISLFEHNIAGKNYVELKYSICLTTLLSGIEQRMILLSYMTIFNENQILKLSILSYFSEFLPI